MVSNKLVILLPLFSNLLQLSSSTPAPTENDGRDYTNFTNFDNFDTTIITDSWTDDTQLTDSPCFITQDNGPPCQTDQQTSTPTIELTQQILNPLTPSTSPTQPVTDNTNDTDGENEIANGDNITNNGASNNNNNNDNDISNAELQQTIIIATSIIGALLLSICIICLFIGYRLLNSGMMMKTVSNSIISNNLSNSSGTQISMHNTVHSMSGETLMTHHSNGNYNIVNTNASSSNLRVSGINVIGVDIGGISDIDNNSSAGHSPRVSGQTTPLPDAEINDVVGTQMVKIIDKNDNGNKQNNRGKRGQSDSEALYGFNGGQHGVHGIQQSDGDVATGLSVVSDNSDNNNNIDNRLSGVSIRGVAGSKVDNTGGEKEGIDGSEVTQVIIDRSSTLGSNLTKNGK